MRFYINDVGKIYYSYYSNELCMLHDYNSYIGIMKNINDISTDGVIYSYMYKNFRNATLEEQEFFKVLTL